MALCLPDSVLRVCIDPLTHSCYSLLWQTRRVGGPAGSGYLRTKGECDGRSRSLVLILSLFSSLSIYLSNSLTHSLSLSHTQTHTNSLAWPARLSFLPLFSPRRWPSPRLHAPTAAHSDKHPSLRRIWKSAWAWEAANRDAQQPSVVDR